MYTLDLKPAKGPSLPITCIRFRPTGGSKAKNVILVASSVCGATKKEGIVAPMFFFFGECLIFPSCTYARPFPFLLVDPGGQCNLPLTLSSLVTLLALCFCVCVCVCVSAGPNGTVEHWHMSSSKRMNSIEEKGNQIFALDYHPSGTTFASCGSDHKIRIYDEATKELLNVMEGG